MRKIRKKHLFWAGGVVLAVGVISAIAGAIIYGPSFLRAVAEVPRDAYATWAAGELVCEHLWRNNNQWPRNWAELARTYEIATREGPDTKTETNRVESNTVVSIDVFLPATFADISNRVTVDWTADVQSLQSAALPPEGRPFNVITLKNGRMRAYEGREPNTMVWEYLQSLKPQPDRIEKNLASNPNSMPEQMKIQRFRRKLKITSPTTEKTTPPPNSRLH